jgi:hypothetical protein
MPNVIDGLEPVAIALDGIEVADSVRLTGIDLETGLRTSITVEKQASDGSMPRARLDGPTQLVLTLSIDHVTTKR